MKKVLMLLAVLAVCQMALADPISGVTVHSRSGRLMSSMEGDKSIDGDTGTMWHSGLNDGAWIIYDLGEITSVTGIAITMSTGNNRKISEAVVSYSNDAVNFSPAGSYTIDTDDGAITDFGLSGVTARYIQIHGSKAFYNNWDPKIYEYPNSPDGKYAISFAEISFVPEPATLGILALGSLALIRRKRTA